MQRVATRCEAAHLVPLLHLALRRAAPKLRPHERHKLIHVDASRVVGVHALEDGLELAELLLAEALRQAEGGADLRVGAHGLDQLGTPAQAGAVEFSRS